MRFYQCFSIKSFLKNALVKKYQQNSTGVQATIDMDGLRVPLDKKCLSICYFKYS